MTLSIIAALSRNHVIGRGNKLPWHLPEDLAHFKRRTLNHTLIMGRKTFDSIGKPLPKRRTIVVTRNPSALPAGVEGTRSIDEALELAGATDEVFIAGGAEIYRQTLDVADRLYLTWIDADIEGDTFFPPFNASAWNEVERTSHAGPLPYSFVTYERAPTPVL